MKNSFLLFFSFFPFPLFCQSQEIDSIKIPDYSQSKNWGALPFIADLADELPDTSLKNMQDSAVADVFYIHPTTHLGLPWNQQTDRKFLNWLTDNVAIQQQASIFNESCKVYAPRYRQATVFSFIVNSEKADTALEIAYSDVKRAFKYYLENYNEGRPIVIAAHSQGSRHAVQLLKDFFDEKSLKNKLVAAYLPGWVIKCDEFKNIPACDSATQSGCFISWNSFVWGADIFNDITKDACCTNPLSWKNDTVYVSRDQHQGSVPPTFKKIDEQTVDARCVNGKLWVHLPADISYWIAGLNYHVLDYNLFYLDIRKNVKTRIENYFIPEKFEGYR